LTTVFSYFGGYFFGNFEIRLALLYLYGDKQLLARLLLIAK